MNLPNDYNSPGPNEIFVNIHQYNTPFKFSKNNYFNSIFDNYLIFYTNQLIINNLIIIITDYISHAESSTQKIHYIHVKIKFTNRLADF